MYLMFSQSSAFCFLFTIFLILYGVNSSTSAVSRDSHYESCISEISKCGTSSVQIAYPFWGNGHPEYCGHPRFQLSCQGNYLTIRIMSRDYEVISIDYNTSTLIIANEAFIGGECPEPKALYNTTMDSSLFRYTSNVKNATVYYDCSDSSFFQGAPFSFSCPGKDRRGLSFLVITNDWNYQLNDVCPTKVYVSIYNSTIPGLFDKSLNVSDVLKKGFEVNWVIDQGQCQECFISDGRCGYDARSGKSTCFCKDGAAYATICPASTRKGLSLEAKVVIGLGAGVVAILVMVALLVYVGPKRVNNRSSTSFSGPETHGLSGAKPDEENTYFGTQLFSYSELQLATRNFDKSKEVGQGGFGTVYHGKLRDGRDVAIKRLYEKHQKQVDQFMNEVEILTRLSHKHLVKLYGCTTRSSRELLLVYEYVPNGTVSDHLHGKHANPGLLSWSLRLRIATEAASALVYLHASDIIHRDVKTNNILLDVNYSVKVADFGLSRLFPLDVSHVSTTPQGSPGYVDPEYHQFYQLTDKSDVYSFGVVLAELLSGKPAVDRKRSRKEINLSNMAIESIKKQAWSEFIDPCLGFESDTKVRDQVTTVAELAFQCLQATKETRPGMDEVLERLTGLCSEESTAEIQDVPEDGFNGCNSLVSSNGEMESDENCKAQSTTLATVDHDSGMSVQVNVSSDTNQTIT